ncbi:Mitochondrial fission factor [Caenorhabditis elegans]|uniref:Mitochondrial fission factor n=1 Tax=Caenorhabditis elegans TaxID=6239 RepID=Q19343_CAEEL|nr:Mitochondrial fission factor [Caenorhabditis elegans]CAA91026.2 Mitochondrial fission factor [Caenorhabditis elegans]|eukprot:NP_510158.2 Mitochondrial Fission Factor [Caenorhabditis elegans]
MQVPDHLSVTGADLMQIDPLNRLMNKFEEARTAMLERMSVPEHITVNGRATLVPEERRVFRTTSLRMEVPNHLNVFDLKEDAINHNNNQKITIPTSFDSSNVQNPYEEVKMMQKRMIVLMGRLGVLENQIVVQKRREKGLLLALIGAVITLAYSYLRR